MIRTVLWHAAVTIGVACWVGCSRADRESGARDAASTNSPSKRTDAKPSVTASNLGSSLPTGFAKSGPRHIPATAEQLREFAKILKYPNAGEQALYDAIMALSRDGSQNAITALLQAFPILPEGKQLLTVKQIGDSPYPNATDVLSQFLTNTSPSIQMEAISTLGNRASLDRTEILGFAVDEKAAGVLTQLALDGEASEHLRVLAVSELGAAPSHKVMEALSRLATSGESDLSDAALRSLGEQPFEHTQSFFENFLKNSAVSEDAKAVALEALGRCKGDASELLMQFSNDSSETLREGAASSLASLDEKSPALTDSLMQWLITEDSGGVRAGLYSAIGSQDNVKPEVLLPLVEGESDPNARFKALEAVTLLAVSGKSTEFVNFVNNTAVPEFERVLSDSQKRSARQRMSAILTLGTIQTEQTQAVLRNLLANSLNRSERSQIEEALKPRSKNQNSVLLQALESTGATAPTPPARP